MGVRTHRKPSPLLNWRIRADEDRFSQFWFYDCPHSNGTIFDYRDRETDNLLTCYIDEGSGLEMIVGDDTLRGRHAIREAARYGWHDKEIEAFFKKEWIFMDGFIVLDDGHRNRRRFNNVWDVQEIVLKESKNE